MHDLFAAYVWTIWDAMPRNSTTNPSTLAKLKDKFGTKPGGAKTGLYDASDFWYKSRAGELGLAVAGSGVGVGVFAGVAVGVGVGVLVA